MSRYSGIAITLNNPTHNEWLQWKKWEEDEDERATLGITYIVMQTEMETVRHYQAMIQFRTPKTHDWIKRNISARCHFERLISASASRTYCKKDSTRMDPDTSDYTRILRFEVGAIRMRPYEHVTEYIFNKEIGTPTESDVAHAYPKAYLMYHSGIRKMVAMEQEPRDFPPQVSIFYGPTGTGKTWKAMEVDFSVYKIPRAEKGGWWWHNYQHEHRVVLDEFRGEIKFGHMLEFLDRTAFTLAVKGANLTMNSRQIVITSNVEPCDWYNGVTDRSPLYRRFEDYAKIYRFDKPLDWYDRDYVKKYEDIIMTLMEVHDGTMRAVIVPLITPLTDAQPRVFSDDDDIEMDGYGAEEEQILIPDFGSDSGEESEDISL